MSGTPRVRSWEQRWAAVLDDAGAAAARRVQRGRAVARRGGVAELLVEPGRLAGVVAEERAAVVPAEIRWPEAGDDVWAAVAGALAREVRFTAALLDGTITPELEEAMADAGLDLLPALTDIEFRCARDGAGVCRHVAAVHAAAGVLVQRDPTLLLELRGRRRDELLRAVRGTGGERPSEELAGLLDVGEDLVASRGDLEAVLVHPSPPADPAALLRRLGAPPGVVDDSGLVATVERAAAVAWRLAAGDGAAAADEELLLSELRALRMASASALARALGRDPAEVRAQLDRLFEEGRVLRTGRGDRVRYRAAG